MNALILITLGSSLQLSGPESEIRFGSSTTGGQAILRATCSSAAPTVVALSPRSFTGFPEGNISVFVLGMPNCLNVLDLKNPCSPFHDALPSLFWCRYSGVGVPLTLGPVRPTVVAITAGLQTTIECPTPPTWHELTHMLWPADATFSTSATANLSIVYYEPEGPNSLTLPFSGGPDGSMIQFDGLSAPPPPAPWPTRARTQSFTRQLPCVTAIRQAD